MYRFRRRGIAARVGTVIAAIAAIAAMALPGAGAAAAAPSSPSASSAASQSHTKCVYKGLSETCTGTFSGDNAYDPWTSTPGGAGSIISHPPVVTVSQAKNLTDQVVNVNWQYFTPSLDENGNPNTDTTAVNYVPLIEECKGTDLTVTEGVGLTTPQNKTALACYAITASQPDDTEGIGNEITGAITHASGATGIPQSYGWGGPLKNADGSVNTGGDPAGWTGQAQFHVETGQTNSLLGCDASSPCSLVIVPNFGGTYDWANPADQQTNTSSCSDHSIDDPISWGEGFPEELGAPANDSHACELSDRIVVPLSFAKTPNNCPQTNPQFSIEGSPMMSRQITQWQAGWCTGPAPVSLTNTSIDESQARSSFLQGGQVFSSRTDMALVTLPPDAATAQASSRKFTYAPLANSGVAMAYYLDDAQSGSLNKEPINRVVLDPRLAAKLTTESYSLLYGCTQEPLPINGGQGPQWPRLPNASITCDPAVSHNPETLYDDPEFLALNKDCRPTGAAADHTCGPSDFPADTTSDGPPDNGEFLPTVLGGNSDMTYQLTDWIHADADAAGFLAGKKDLWGMEVNKNYQNISYPSQLFQTLDQGPGPDPQGPITCTKNISGGIECDKGEVVGTLNVAWNFVTPLTNINDDLLEYKPNAKQSTMLCTLPNGAACTAPGQFGFLAAPQDNLGVRDLFSELDLGDIAAEQFPTTAMVNGVGEAVAPTQASVEAAVKDMKTNPDGITQFVNQSSTDPAAYPLAMVDYAMVPTCGLSSSEASAIANFLHRAATTGQAQGSVPGDLQPGYYPLTSAQRAQTLKAAQEVKTQDCKSVPLDKTVSGHPGVNDVGPNNANGPTGTSSNPGGGKASNGKTSASGVSGKTPASSPATGKIRTAAFGQKSADSGLTGILLLIAIIVGALLLVGGPAAWVLTATGKWPIVLRWLKPVLTRLMAARTWLTGLMPTGRA